MKFEVKTIPRYRAMGLKCDVSFTDFERIKDTVESSINRLNEFDYVVNPETRLGLSYHLRSDGFTHYSVFKVTDEQPLLDGMVEINVPEMTYLITEHTGDNIESTYHNILKWIEESEYTPYKEQGVEYFDDLPIKHESFIEGSTNFEIRIPITK